MKSPTRSMTGSRISEKRVQTEVVNNLHAIGFFVTSFSQAQRAQQTAGIPDLFAVHGRFRVQLWIEMKAPDRRNERHGGLSFEQVQWHVNARHHGVDVIVAYGWHDVKRALQARGVPIEG